MYVVVGAVSRLKSVRLQVTSYQLQVTTSYVSSVLYCTVRYSIGGGGRHSLPLPLSTTNPRYATAFTCIQLPDAMILMCLYKKGPKLTTLDKVVWKTDFVADFVAASITSNFNGSGLQISQQHKAGSSCVNQAIIWAPSPVEWTCIHVNLYGMPVSLTDFHPFRLLTGVHLKSYGL